MADSSEVLPMAHGPLQDFAMQKPGAKAHRGPHLGDCLDESGGGGLATTHIKVMNIMGVDQVLTQHPALQGPEQGKE